MHTIYFDLETGGLQMEHPVIQLAAVAVDQNLVEIDSFERKIQFVEASADPEALMLNHYDAEVWKREAKPFQTVVRDFDKFLFPYRDIQMVSKAGKPYSVALLGGYNAANFDAPRLQRMFKNASQFLAAHPRTLDVLQGIMWRDYLAGEFHLSYKLGDVCARLGIELTGAHDALADVRGTVELVRRLKGAM